MYRILPLLLACVITLLPRSAFAQRFGGDYGAAAGFWLVYVDLGINEDLSFGRDVGGAVMLGGRGFLQVGRVRLGGGAFGGGFTNEGLNESGNRVQGGLSAGGLTAEYLAVQQNLEVTLGGMVGGGVLTIEERISVSGDVEELRRYRDSMFVGYPWVRVGYNPAPFVNVGLQLGYFVGTGEAEGFAVGLDIMVGVIP